MFHMNESCPTWMSHVHSRRVRLVCAWTQSVTDEWVTCVAVCCSVLQCIAMRCRVLIDTRCDIWMSHVPYEWVMPNMHESRQIWSSHNRCVWLFPYEWVTSHMNESCPIRMSHANYAWITSNMIESRLMRVALSHMNESRPIWMSHVPYGWVTSHIWTSHNWCVRLVWNMWSSWLTARDRYVEFVTHC